MMKVYRRMSFQQTPQKNDVVQIPEKARKRNSLFITCANIRTEVENTDQEWMDNQDKDSNKRPNQGDN